MKRGLAKTLDAEFVVGVSFERATSSIPCRGHLGDADSDYLHGKEGRRFESVRGLCKKPAYGVVSVSQEGNDFARRLYAKLGYVEAPTDPLRVSGVIVLRGQLVEVDDTLVHLMKRL